MDEATREKMIHKFMINRIDILERALECDINFYNAHYIVFSDYPSEKSVHKMLGLDFIDDDLRIVLLKEYTRILTES